jgi:3-(3-hydroxy-phenyl)propionate hydroxylase
MLMPGDDPATIVQPESLWKLVSPWVTPEQADIERAVIYTFHSIIAERWRQDRLLLAGDAAHQTPPFLGQGMCAAIRDVSNLAWKLEAVLRGRAGAALLDTYASERSPHVHAFIDLAVRLGDIIQTTDPEQARERDARFKSGKPEIFEFPSPRLGPGLRVGDAPAVGQPLGQPTLDDGQLLDRRVGYHFLVLGRPAVLEAATSASKARWQQHQAVVMPATDQALAQWLDKQGVDAIIVRPDRYIMGMAQGVHELDSLSALLPVAV